jgi:hypothetical protein
VNQNIIISANTTCFLAFTISGARASNKLLA